MARLLLQIACKHRICRRGLRSDSGLARDDTSTGGNDGDDHTQSSGIGSVSAHHARLAWRQSSEWADRSTQALFPGSVRVLEKPASAPATIGARKAGNLLVELRDWRPGGHRESAPGWDWRKDRRNIPLFIASEHVFGNIAFVLLPAKLNLLEIHHRPTKIFLWKRVVCLCSDFKAKRAAHPRVHGFNEKAHPPATGKMGI